MRASKFEFRFRLLIIAAVLFVGFWSPFSRDRTTVWMFSAGSMAHQHWLSVQVASLVAGYAAAAFALGGALLRTSATAYLGAGVVFSPQLQAQRVVAAGPYRYLRNPLYVGAYFNYIALAVFMPLYGAVLALIALAVFLLRLALLEEARMVATPGYAAYAAHVPRWLPRLRSGIAPSGARPQWALAIFSESYMWLSFLGIAALVPQFNAVRVIQAVLASFGLSLMVRGFVLRGPDSC